VFYFAIAIEEESGRQKRRSIPGYIKSLDKNDRGGGGGGGGGGHRRLSS